MRRLRKRSSVVNLESIGAPPGTLTAPAGAFQPQLSVIAYSETDIVEIENVTVSQLKKLQEQYSVVWVNLVGLASTELISELGGRFGLHRLALEDTMNTTQRPKFDDYGDNQYLVVRMPVSSVNLDTEQVSIFMGRGFLLTIQEQPGDCFDSVRTRLRINRPRLRQRGSDYLAYAILDRIIDSFFPLLELAASRLDELELSILEEAEDKQIAEIHDLKRVLISLRRYLGPLREMITAFMNEDNGLIVDQTRVYLRDCNDHAKQAFDLVESYRDIATGLMDLYLSMMSQRMNEVMKVLTIIATLFIPLSFIAGLYGMNFDASVSRWNMPELSWAFGYPAALGMMLIVAGIMMGYFWRKGWFR